MANELIRLNDTSAQRGEKSANEGRKNAMEIETQRHVRGDLAVNRKRMKEGNVLFNNAFQRRIWGAVARPQIVCLLRVIINFRPPKLPTVPLAF